LHKKLGRLSLTEIFNKGVILVYNTDVKLNSKELTVILESKFASRIYKDVRANVSAHPYCARNSRRHAMPRHTLSARAVEEM